MGIAHVWVGLHLLSSVTTSMIVVLNAVIFARAYKIVGILEHGNQTGTDRWHRAQSIASGAVARGMAHLSIGFVTIVSIVSGTRYVSTLPGDALWAYIIPVLLAYNITILAMGYLTILAYQGVVRLYHDVGGTHS